MLSEDTARQSLQVLCWDLSPLPSQSHDLLKWTSSCSPCDPAVKARQTPLAWLSHSCQHMLHQWYGRKTSVIQQSNKIESLVSRGLWRERVGKAKTCQNFTRHASLSHPDPNSDEWKKMRIQCNTYTILFYTITKHMQYINNSQEWVK